jgi:outer membrane receptor for ferric coprogen and ferric-rhodotorulic acid
MVFRRPNPRRPARAGNLPCAPITRQGNDASWVSKANALAFAVGCALTSLTAAAVLAPGSAQAAGSPASREYDIPAGQLGDVLAQFAATSKVLLSFDPQMLAGMRSSGLHGRYSVHDGFSRLLDGSGYELVDTGGGRYALRQAATASTVTTLAPVTVAGTALFDGSTEGTGAYTTQAVTIGSKIPVPVREIPQTVSVVTQQQIQDQNLNTISDTLLQTPGVTVVNTSTNNFTYYSRGFQLTTVQQDGVPLEYNNNQTYTPFDMAMYDHVEVLRGPSGLFTGSGQPSGTVNLVRKRPTSTFAMSGELSGGSFDFYRGMLDVGGPLNKSGSVRGRFVASSQDNNYFYDVAHNRNTMFYGTVEADVTPDTTVRLGMTYQDSNATPFIGLPAYTNKQLLDVPRSSFLGNVQWGRRPSTTVNPFIQIEHQLGNDWSLKVSNEYFHQDTDWLRAGAGTGVDPTTNTFSGLSSTFTQYKEAQNSTDVSLSGPLKILGRTHQLVFGLNRRNEDYYYAPGKPVTIPGTFSIYDSTYNAPEPASYSAKSITDTNTTQYGAYASGRFSLADPLTLVLGGRLSWYDSTIDTIYPAGKPRTKVSESAVFTPYAALVYDLSRTLSVYGSYTSIFQPQSLSTYDGSLLNPVKGEQYEVGLKGEFLDKKLETSLAFFLINQTNTPQSDLANPGFYLTSGGTIQSKGIDAQVTGQLSPGWNVTLGYTYNETKYTKDTAYQGQPYSTVTPKHIFKVWSSYDFQSAPLKGWSVGGGLYAVSSFGNNGFMQSGYATLNASIGYQISKHVHAGLNLNNLTNRKYYQTVGGYDQYNNVYGAPFSAILTLRASF